MTEEKDKVLRVYGKTTKEAERMKEYLIGLGLADSGCEVQVGDEGEPIVLPAIQTRRRLYEGEMALGMWINFNKDELVESIVDEL